MTPNERKARELRQLEALAVHARKTILRLEVQDEIDAQRQEKFEYEPMIGEPTWHVHEHK